MLSAAFSRNTQSILKPTIIQKQQQVVTHNLQLHHQNQQQPQNIFSFTSSSQSLNKGHLMKSNYISSLSSWLYSPFLTYTLSTPFCTTQPTQQSKSKSMIESLVQVQKGNAMLKIHQFQLALFQYLSALEFLPNDGDALYNQEYQFLLFKLIKSHAKSGKSMQDLVNLDSFENAPALKQFVQILAKLQIAVKQGDKGNVTTLEQLMQISEKQKLWKRLVKIQAYKLAQKEYVDLINIDEIQQCKDFALKYLSLTFYEQVPARKDTNRESKYVQACSDILKEIKQKKNATLQIIKPLILTASNLIAGAQYIQSQGLLSHCISTKQQLFKKTPELLNRDQEYIMCKLKLANIFNNVQNRVPEATKIRQQFEKQFDEKKFFIQEIVEMNFESL